MNTLVIQVILLAVFAVLMSILEKTAALRGAKGSPMHPAFDITIRVIFLAILTFPIVAAFPWTILLVLAYLPTYVSLCELHGGRPGANAWVRGSFVFRLIARYFKLQLIKTAEIDPKKRYIIGLHPHGILPFGTVTNMVTDATGFSSKFPGLELRGLAASFCFYVPIYRDLLLAGFVCDAARYSAKRLLDSGKSIFLVPGGATEALYASPEEDVLVLKSRKGFVRLALQYGADLIPCFSFNENNTFSQLSTSHNSHPWISKLKKKFQAVFGISLPLITNIIPKRAEVVTVVGAPIPVGKAREPTEKEVEETLETYIKALKALYAEHGPKYNQPRDKKLVIN